jgi:fibronectin type 3 domain-containing protein
LKVNNAYYKQILLSDGTFRYTCNICGHETAIESDMYKHMEQHVCSESMRSESPDIATKIKRMTEDEFILLRWLIELESERRGIK